MFTRFLEFVFVTRLEQTCLELGSQQSSKFSRGSTMILGLKGLVVGLEPCDRAASVHINLPRYYSLLSI